MCVFDGGFNVVLGSLRCRNALEKERTISTIRPSFALLNDSSIPLTFPQFGFHQ